MLFASKAIIYLNEERGRAARNNFFTAIECRSRKIADRAVNSGIFLQFEIDTDRKTFAM